MSKKKQARRNTSALPALTPDYSTAVVMRIVPDLRTEELLFWMYLEQKRKADDLQRQKQNLLEELKDRKRWNRVKHLTQLKPHQHERTKE